MTALPRRSRLLPALTATVAFAALAGCGAETPETETRPAAGSASTPPASPGTTGTPSETAATQEPTPAATPSGERTTVGVYFVGDAPQGPRLFREFRSVPADNVLEEAAALLTAGDVLDPDYRTLLPRGSFASIQATDGQLVVELADGAWTERPEGMSRSQARLAVQQLVHTLQAVSQARVPMTVLLDGEPTTLLGIDTAAGVTNDDPLDVLALVNVTSPEQGSTVSGSFRASGVASAPEANVPWEIRSGQDVVLSGFSTAEGWMDKLYPWQSEEIDVSGLAPGSYTFVASTGEMSEGEGFGATTDTKELTVR